MINGLDVLFVFLLAGLSYCCYLIGFTEILAHVLGVVGGMILSTVLYPVPIAIWNLWFDPSPWINVMSFVVLFFLGGMVVSMAAKLIKKTLSLLWLSWLDRLMGAVTGLFIGGILIGVGMLAFLHLAEPPLVVRNSLLTRIFAGGLIFLMDQLPWLFGEFVRDFQPRM